MNMWKIKHQRPVKHNDTTTTVEVVVTKEKTSDKREDMTMPVGCVQLSFVFRCFA